MSLRRFAVALVRLLLGSAIALWGFAGGASSSVRLRPSRARHGGVPGLDRRHLLPVSGTALTGTVQWRAKR